MASEAKQLGFVGETAISAAGLEPATSGLGIRVAVEAQSISPRAGNGVEKPLQQKIQRIGMLEGEGFPNLNPPEPGVYRKIPEAVYHAWPYASASRLNLLAERSAAHVRWEMDHPTPPTPEMVIGSACHSVILTPERFARDYRLAGTCQAILKSGDRKGQTCGKPGVALYGGTAWYCGTHYDGADDGSLDGVAILTPEQGETVEMCHRAVTHHPYAGGNLDAATERELSIVWDCPHTGLRLKSRIDAYRPGVLMDLKSTRDASPEAFAKSIVSWGYHIQIATYLDALAAVGMTADVASIIAFEKEGPWAVAMYELDPEDIAIGRRQSVELRARFAECEASGIWPGYGEKATVISLPDWYRARHG